MKKTILLFLVVLAPLLGRTQEFAREAGFRGGLSAGLTYRQYLRDNLSYEALLSFRHSGMQLTLLRQIHETTLQAYAENFYFLYGYGGHAGYYFTDRYRSAFWKETYYQYRRFSPLLGVDGFAAIEYRLNTIPLTVAFDYKPYFEVSLYQFFRIQIWDFAFAVKYRF